MRKIFTIAILALSINAFAQIPTDSLKAWYPFNGNANDESGNGNNGTVNGAILTTDRFGNANSAYSFDGISNLISVPNSSSLNPQNYTISAWFKFTTNNQNDRFILSKARGSANENSYAIFYASNMLWIIVDGNSALQNSVYFTNGNWYHMSFVFDTDLNTITLYLNGSSVAYVNITQNTLYDTEPVLIGAESDYSTLQKFFEGSIDDIRIYNRALDSSEINSLYNEGICYQTITVTDTLIINANLTGFNPITYQNSIKIFPNPTNDNITIDFGSNYSTMNGYTLKITNSLSQIIYTTPVNQQITTVDLSTWTGNGIYFVHLIDAQSNTIDIRKIVLQ